MMITRVTQQNMDAFAPLIPEELLDDVFFEGQIDLRAVRPLNVLSRTQINRKLEQLSGMLEPVFLYTGRDQKADIVSMFQFAAIQAYLKYPTDTRMHVVCRSDATAVLVERMFPDREPLVVRHGEVRRL